MHMSHTLSYATSTFGNRLRKVDGDAIAFVAFIPDYIGIKQKLKITWVRDVYVSFRTYSV